MGAHRGGHALRRRYGHAGGNFKAWEDAVYSALEEMPSPFPAHDGRRFRSMYRRGLSPREAASLISEGLFTRSDGNHGVIDYPERIGG